jgi:hypothetical protein
MWRNHFLRLTFLAMFATAPAVSAHVRSDSTAVAADAVIIPSLPHGQMAVIADHRREIVALGQDIAYRDDTVSRLVSYIHAQRMACLWGLVPESIPDEASPFNECSHAYLAATKALLLYLATVPQMAEIAGNLRDRVELEMLENGASLQMCQYSDLPFNTSEVLYPHWADVVAHPPSLFSIAGFFIASAFGSWLLLRPRAVRQPVGI